MARHCDGETSPPIDAESFTLINQTPAAFTNILRFIETGKTYEHRDDSTLFVACELRAL